MTTRTPHNHSMNRRQKIARESSVVLNVLGNFEIQWSRSQFQRVKRPNDIHLFQKTLSERTGNGSCRTEIAQPKGTVISIFGMQNSMSSWRGAKLGSLSNHDDDGSKNPTNLHIWQWKTVFLRALHVHFSSFNILKTFLFFYDVTWPVLQLCGRYERMMTNVQFFPVMSV